MNTVATMSITDKIKESLQKKINQYPVNSNRASSLGHECVRYLVFERTRWQEKHLHDTQLQAIFDLGNVLEKSVLAELTEAGIPIIEQQRAFSWPKYGITGHVDGKVLLDGEAYPIEIKSMAPYTFDSINNYKDMLSHKHSYVRRYPAQLTLYELMDNKDMAVFLLKNKVSGAIKEIWMPLDFTYGESLIRKAEAVNKHVTEGTLPDPIMYDENQCTDCGYAHICMPDRIGKEVEVIDDDELVKLIERYYELKPAAKEYDEVNEHIKSIVEGKEKLLVGSYFIDGKWQSRTSYDVPPEIKAQYKTVTRFWKRSILKV